MEIKSDVLRGLEKVRKDLKARSVSQMREQGLVVEMISEKNVGAIRSCELHKIGFVEERPKMIDPSFIIYDVEREYKEEELKEDLIKKNFEISSDSDEIKRTMRKRKFAQAKDRRRVNWIIKLPAKHHKMLTSKGRAFLIWRSYGIEDNINVIKYYQCHGYGHIAKFCNLRK